VCAPVATFAAGSKHLVAACMSATGNVRLYADGVATPLASAEAGVAAPELTGGSLLVGGGSVVETSAYGEPFHGYISRAAVCADRDVTACR
jgi:hypothetical protein